MPAKAAAPRVCQPRAGCLTAAPKDLPAPISQRFEYVGALGALADHPFDLGYGAYAVVRKIREHGTGEHFAVKIVEKKPLEQRDMLQRLYTEVRRLHPPTRAARIVRMSTADPRER